MRTDPALRLACGRLSYSWLDLCSQCVETLPDLKIVIRFGDVLVDLWLSTYAASPESVTLDIDDTLGVSWP
ncbi:IS1380 family transposase [Mesorhizobium sp. J8]|nr:IS1380 family transposase [Mesorhizobium sp. J8]